MKFGLITTDLDRAEQWAVSEGLSIVSKSGLLLKLEGDFRTVEVALGISLKKHPTGWHTTDQPRLPAGATAVSGLSTAGRIYPHSIILDNPLPTISTGAPDGLPGPGYSPQEIASAYGVVGGEDDTGVTIGIAAWGVSWQQSDLDAYCTDTKLPSFVPDVVLIDGYTNVFNSGDGPESTLDLCAAHAMAPAAIKRIYMAPGGTNDTAWALQVTNLLNEVLTDDTNLAALNISYGDGEDQFLPTDLDAWETLIAAITAKGTVVTVSSGDAGAYGLHMIQGPQKPRVEAPASCPSALAVGGTELDMNGMTVEDEWAWSNDLPYQCASGGGYSTHFTSPSYQTLLKQKMRGVPDVAAHADPSPGFFLIYDGAPTMIGGTSLSAPLIAGILARLTQAKGSTLGDIHEALYAHGASLCKSITVGNNNCYAVTGFEAQPGWDAVTGWGSPIYPQWLAVLAKGGGPVNPNVDAASLTVDQLATAKIGAYGDTNVALQEDAQTVQEAVAQATFFGFCHQPTGYFDAAQAAAARLWAAGVRK